MTSNSCGVFMDFIKGIRKIQEDINNITRTVTNNNRFKVETVNFANPNTFDFNEDIQKVYDSLDSCGDTSIKNAAYIKDSIQDYIKNTMSPELQKFEILIAYSAFLNRENKPVLDLFYKIDDVKGCVMRDPKEFAYVMSRGFMVYFYKVSYMLSAVCTLMIQYTNIYCFHYVGKREGSQCSVDEIGKHQLYSYCC